MSGPIRMFWLDDVNPTPPGGLTTQQTVYTSLSSDVGQHWTPKQLLYFLQKNPPAGGTISGASEILSISSGNPKGASLILRLTGITGVSNQAVRIPTAGGIPTTPTLIDNTNLPIIPVGAVVLSGPINYKDGKQYFIGVHSGGDGKESVYQSSDGVTWTILDAAHEPPNSSGIYFYPDSGNKIYFAYTTGTAGNITLIEFNLDTGLWGATHDPLSLTSSQAAQYIAVAPNGAVLIFYADSTSGSTLTRAAYLPAPGGSWTTGIAVDNNIPGGNSSQLNTFVIDQNSVCHVFYAYNGNPGGVNNNHTYYRQINMTTGVLSALLFSFPAVFGLVGSGINYGLIVNGTTIVLPVFYDPTQTGQAPILPGVYIGTPLSNPGWQLVAVDSDTVNDSASAPILVFDSGGPSGVSATIQLRLQGVQRYQIR